MLDPLAADVGEFAAVGRGASKFRIGGAVGETVESLADWDGWLDWAKAVAEATKAMADLSSTDRITRLLRSTTQNLNSKNKGGP